MQEIKELNNLLSKYVDQGFFPGIQGCININNDTYIGKYGLNNIETSEPILDDSIYRIWSMTKPIVAVVLLCCCVVVLLCCWVVVLLCCCVVVLLCCCVVVLLCCFFLSFLSCCSSGLLPPWLFFFRRSRLCKAVGPHGCEITRRMFQRF